MIIFLYFFSLREKKTQWTTDGPLSFFFLFVRVYGRCLSSPSRKKRLESSERFAMVVVIVTVVLLNFLDFFFVPRPVSPRGGQGKKRRKKEGKKWSSVEKEEIIQANNLYIHIYLILIFFFSSAVAAVWTYCSWCGRLCTSLGNVAGWRKKETFFFPFFRIILSFSLSYQAIALSTLSTQRNEKSVSAYVQFFCFVFVFRRFP